VIVEAPWIVKLVIADGIVYLSPVVQVDDPAAAGIFTTTVALVLLFDGRAARKSASEGLTALQTAVVHDCAPAAMGMISSNNRKKNETVHFMGIETPLSQRLHYAPEGARISTEKWIRAF
jgi:hypothetical protein